MPLSLCNKDKSTPEASVAAAPIRLAFSTTEALLRQRREQDFPLRYFSGRLKCSRLSGDRADTRNPQRPLARMQQAPQITDYEYI